MVRREIYQARKDDAECVYRTVARLRRERGSPAATVFCRSSASFYTLHYVYSAPRKAVVSALYSWYSYLENTLAASANGRHFPLSACSPAAPEPHQFLIWNFKAFILRCLSFFNAKKSQRGVPSSTPRAL